MDATDSMFRRQLEGILQIPANPGVPITVRGADALLAQDFPRHDTVDALLQRLAWFGFRHFEFFDENLLEDGQGRLTPSRVFSRESVLALIVKQIQYDAEVIVRAAQQRLVPEYQPTLKQADALAYLALKTARDELGLNSQFQVNGEKITALCYFSKSPEIRVVPYAPVALIGIPMSSLNEKRDFLAIPHEIGHYIYHHRQIDFSNDPVSRHYAAQSNSFAKWQEEAFADVCAALIAGAVMVFDFQELSKRFQRESFISREDDHPSPFLRPLLYSHALRAWRDPDNLVLANLLDERWGREVAKRWSRELNIPAASIRRLLERLDDKDDDFGLSAPHDVSYLEALRKECKSVTLRGERMILGPDLAALADQALARLWMTGDWSGALNNMVTTLNAGEDDLDAGFIQLIDDAQINDPAPDLVLPIPANADPWVDWVKRERFFGGRTPDEFPDPIGVGKDSFAFFDEPTDPLRAQGQPPEYIWQQLWFANGWTSGPGDAASRPP